MELRIEIKNDRQRKAFDALMEQLGPAIDEVKSLTRDVRDVNGRVSGFHKDLSEGKVRPPHLQQRFLEKKGGMHKRVPATKEARAALAASLRVQLSPPGSPRGAAARPRPVSPGRGAAAIDSISRSQAQIISDIMAAGPPIRPGMENAAAALMARDDRVRMAQGLPDPAPAAGALAGEVPCHLNPVLSFAIDAVIVLATCAGSFYLMDVGTSVLSSFFDAFNFQAAAREILMALYTSIKAAGTLVGNAAGVITPIAGGIVSEFVGVATSASHTVHKTWKLAALAAWYRYITLGNSVSDDLNQFVVQPVVGAATTVGGLARGVRTRAQAARDAVVARYAAEVQALPNPVPLTQSITQAAATVQTHRENLKRNLCLLIDRVVNSRAVIKAGEAKAAVDRVLADPEFDLPAVMGRSGGKHRKRTMHKRSKKHHKKSRKHRS